MKCSLFRELCDHVPRRACGCTCETAKVVAERMADNSMHGEWMCVPGISSDKLLVSSQGWVRNLSSGGKVRKLGAPKQGQLTQDGKYRIRSEGKSYLVHVLVALAFHGPKPSLHHTVDHIDRNSKNNAASNLRWATRHEQKKNQRVKKKVQRTAKAVILKKPLGNDVLRFGSLSDAAKYLGCSVANVSQAAKRGVFAFGHSVAFDDSDQEDLAGEIWLVAFCDKTLRVSNMGRIQRADASGGGWGSKSTPLVGDGQSYVRVRCTNSLLLHRVIKITFHGYSDNPDECEVDHVNRNRNDNRLENLRWCTKKDNLKNRVKWQAVARV